MKRTSNTPLSLAAAAVGLALAINVLAAPAAVAGDRGDRWERDRYHRAARHDERDRHAYGEPGRKHRWHARHHRAHKRPHPVWKRHHRRKHHHHQTYVVKKDYSVAPVLLGIGAGIITYVILNESHGHGY